MLSEVKATGLEAVDVFGSGAAGDRLQKAVGADGVVEDLISAGIEYVNIFRRLIAVYGADLVGSGNQLGVLSKGELAGAAVEGVFENSLLKTGVRLRTIVGHEDEAGRNLQVDGGAADREGSELSPGVGVLLLVVRDQREAAGIVIDAEGGEVTDGMPEAGGGGIRARKRVALGIRSSDDIPGGILSAACTRRAHREKSRPN